MSRIWDLSDWDTGSGAGPGIGAGFGMEFGSGAEVDTGSASAGMTSLGPFKFSKKVLTK